MSLVVRDLRVVFDTAKGPVWAVDGVDLDVAPGAVLGLVGESGSGKSVTLRAIARLLHANATVSGQVHWKGEDVLTMPPDRLLRLRGAELGIVFQEPMAALNPVLTIGLQIDESLAAHTELDAKGRRARALELLDLVGIAAGAARLGQYPHEFSGGMRQRAMIAIALASSPRLLLADEPTTALDVTIQDQILRLLLRLKAELGMGLVLVTHDLGVVAQTCERVAVMYAGRVCEAGPVADVFAAPRHAYTQALLRAMPGEGARAGARLVPIPGQAPRLDAPAPGCAFQPRCTVSEPDCETRRPAMATQGERRFACFAEGRL
jgi:peptide/nickel transport system ATP-binding protein/oligopeptide transport system ATP-binding protein